MVGTSLAQARRIAVGSVFSPFWPEHPSQCMVSTPGASLVLKFRKALIAWRWPPVNCFSGSRWKLPKSWEVSKVPCFNLMSALLPSTLGTYFLPWSQLYKSIPKTKWGPCLAYTGLSSPPPFFFSCAHVCALSLLSACVYMCLHDCGSIHILGEC